MIPLLGIKGSGTVICLMGTTVRVFKMHTPRPYPYRFSGQAQGSLSLKPPRWLWQRAAAKCGGCSSRGRQAWASPTAGTGGLGLCPHCTLIHWFLKMFLSSGLSRDGKTQHALGNLFLRHREKEGCTGAPLREEDSGRRGLEPQERDSCTPVSGASHAGRWLSEPRAPASPVLTLPPASPEGEPGSLCADTGKRRG